MTAQSAVVDFERNAVFLRLIDCFEVVCIFKALKSEKNAILRNDIMHLLYRLKSRGFFLTKQ